MSMSAVITSPMPRTMRMKMLPYMVRSGHAAHDAERAGKGGEYCDEDFEECAPVEVFHRLKVNAAELRVKNLFGFYFKFS